MLSLQVRLAIQQSSQQIDAFIRLFSFKPTVALRDIVGASAAK